jgi:serine/threonine protein kinase
MFNLRQFGLNWEINPKNKKSVKPTDFLKRMSNIEYDKNTEIYTIERPDNTQRIYTRTTKLGSGTYGVVYLCTTENKVCIVKEINDDIESVIMEAIIQIIIAETTKNSRYPSLHLKGPFAPTIYDIAYNTKTRTGYIFSELMHKTIDDLIIGWKNEPKHITGIKLAHTYLCISTILEELYKKLEFNHRDFKSDNCMYIRDTEGYIMPRIIDFGFSCINYKGLTINTTNSFTYCGLKGRDMSQLIYETVFYNKTIIPSNIKKMANTLLTFKHDNKICHILEKNCGVSSWSNTYDFLNTQQENPNGDPKIVSRVMRDFLEGKDWTTRLVSSNKNNKTRRKTKSKRSRTYAVKYRS